MASANSSSPLAVRVGACLPSYLRAMAWRGGEVVFMRFRRPSVVQVGGDRFAAASLGGSRDLSRSGRRLSGVGASCPVGFRSSWRCTPVQPTADRTGCLAAVGPGHAMGPAG